MVEKYGRFLSIRKGEHTLLQWIRKKCFTNLEKEDSKNKLLLFVFIVSVLAGEVNVLMNNLFLSNENLLFLLGIFLSVAIGFALIKIRRLVGLFKYIMMVIFLGFTILQLGIFHSYPSVTQVLYFNLALALIYLNGRLVLFVGALSLLFLLVGQLFWKQLFFPRDELSNIMIGIFAETTLVLWAATRIGTSFNLIANSNQRMKQLLMKNQSQFELIERQNKMLAEYADQIEQLTLREERQRMAKEIHDTVGHTVTSIVLGMEMTKHLITTDAIQAIEKLDNMIKLAQEGLAHLRDHIYDRAFEENEIVFLEECERIIHNINNNTGTKIAFSKTGEETSLPQPTKVALLRCIQESITNALRHGKATMIEVKIMYENHVMKVLIMDNGVGFSKIEFGLGLTAMNERVKALCGDVHLTSMEGNGTSVLVTIPISQMKQPETIRVLIVDDQEFISESLGILLSAEKNIQVIGTANNGIEALEMCSKQIPDVILMDIHMPELDGIKSTRIIKDKWPQIKIMMMTTFGKTQTAVEAIDAGAEGYLIKSKHSKNIAKAIQLVFNGCHFITQEMASKLVNDLKETGLNKGLVSVETMKSHSLKKRELQILKCLAQGLRYKEISQKCEC